MEYVLKVIQMSFGEKLAVSRFLVIGDLMINLINGQILMDTFMKSLYLICLLKRLPKHGILELKT